MPKTAERFEPERAEEVRAALREAFDAGGELLLADVAFERGPEFPEGEVIVAVQTAKKIHGNYLIMVQHYELGRLLELLDGSGIASEMRELARWCTSRLALKEEGIAVEGDPLQRMARASDEPLPPKASLPEKPMTPEAFLRLRGWTRFFDVEIAAERKRRKEEGDELWFVADSGVRYVDPRVGLKSTLMEALGTELVRAARDLGGLERLLEVLDDAKEAAENGRTVPGRE